MVAANKLLHLLEAFSTPWYLFSNPANHHLVFFLLEVFNNMIQYQFDGRLSLGLVKSVSKSFDTSQFELSLMWVNGNANVSNVDWLILPPKSTTAFLHFLLVLVLHFS